MDPFTSGEDRPHADAGAADAARAPSHVDRSATALVFLVDCSAALAAPLDGPAAAEGTAALDAVLTAIRAWAGRLARRQAPGASASPGPIVAVLLGYRERPFDLIGGVDFRFRPLDALALPGAPVLPGGGASGAAEAFAVAADLLDRAPAEGGPPASARPLVLHVSQAAPPANTTALGRLRARVEDGERPGLVVQVALTESTRGEPGALPGGRREALVEAWRPHASTAPAWLAEALTARSAASLSAGEPLAFAAESRADLWVALTLVERAATALRAAPAPATAMPGLAAPVVAPPVAPPPAATHAEAGQGGAAATGAEASSVTAPHGGEATHGGDAGPGVGDAVPDAGEDAAALTAPLPAAEPKPPDEVGAAEYVWEGRPGEDFGPIVVRPPGTPTTPLGAGPRRHPGAAGAATGALGPVTDLGGPSRPARTTDFGPELAARRGARPRWLLPAALLGLLGVLIATGALLWLWTESVGRSAPVVAPASPVAAPSPVAVEAPAAPPSPSPAAAPATAPPASSPVARQATPTPRRPATPTARPSPAAVIVTPPRIVARPSPTPPRVGATPLPTHPVPTFAPPSLATRIWTERTFYQVGEDAQLCYESATGEHVQVSMLTPDGASRVLFDEPLAPGRQCRPVRVERPGLHVVNMVVSDATRREIARQSYAFWVSGQPGG